MNYLEYQTALAALDSRYANERATLVNTYRLAREAAKQAAKIDAKAESFLSTLQSLSAQPRGRVFSVPVALREAVVRLSRGWLRVHADGVQVIKDDCEGLM
jgi:hypothetical protein